MDKQYNHQLYEPQAQQLWEQKQIYTAENNPGQLYSIDTPPPTVSGSLHIGHIFSYTQTDIIARYKRMKGFAVFYPFGFDDNGLATERYVEKKRNIQAYQLARSEFIKICLEETQLAAQDFKDLWQRIGLSVDWRHAYSTISDEVRAIAQASFIELYNKGFIYRKEEPALYCTLCRTSVAQAELDDKEKDSFFNDIVFKDERGNDLIIGTTRPELLSSCVALFFNPADARYTHLAGKRAIVPLFNNSIPIFADEHVNPEKGSGLVMCSTFGDKADIEWYKKFKLPYKQSIGLDGRFTQDTGLLAGCTVSEARVKILEELAQHTLLIKQQPIKHTVNVHERCKKEIEFVILKQWFIHILEHKKKLLELADSIAWYPEFMKARYKNWVENIGWDWCISRQRFFGIPFPVWHCKKCGHILLADQSKLPVDPQEMRYPGTSCPSCKSTDIIPDTDVMDTWNTSSLTPYICYSLYSPKASISFSGKNIEQFIPMSMRPQAHDIIRTWAFYTIAKAWMHTDTIPWKTIVISGHVLSDHKEKISKSKGNNLLEPRNLLAQYSADAVRYWTASGSLGYDIAFSENQLKIGNRLITKLWNAFRFIQEHTQTVQPAIVPQSFETVNEWILHQISGCYEQYCTQLEQHEFSLALNHVERFFWHDFCDNYLELIKHQLFNPHDYQEQAVHATQWTLYVVGLRILQLYAPYLPYITEAIYQDMYQKNYTIASIHQSKYANIPVYSFEQSATLMQSIIAIASTVRKLKTEKQLSLKAPLEHLIIQAADDIRDRITVHEQLIRGITQAKIIVYTKTDKPTMIYEENGLWNACVIL